MRDSMRGTLSGRLGEVCLSQVRRWDPHASFHFNSQGAFRGGASRPCCHCWGEPCRPCWWVCGCRAAAKSSSKDREEASSRAAPPVSPSHLPPGAWMVLAYSHPALCP